MVSGVLTVKRKTDLTELQSRRHVVDDNHNRSKESTPSFQACLDDSIALDEYVRSE